MADPNSHNSAPNPDAAGTWDMSDAPAYRGGAEAATFIKEVNQANAEARTEAKQQLDAELEAAKEGRHAEYEALRGEVDAGVKEIQERIAQIQEQLKEAKRGRSAEIRAIHERAAADIRSLVEGYNSDLATARGERDDALAEITQNAVSELEAIAGEVSAAEGDDTSRAEAIKQENQELRDSLSAAVRERLEGRGYTEEEMAKLVDEQVDRMMDGIERADSKKAVSTAAERARAKAKVEKAKAEILNPKKSPLRSFVRKFWGGKNAEHAGEGEPEPDDSLESRIASVERTHRESRNAAEGNFQTVKQNMDDQLALDRKEVSDRERQEIAAVDDSIKELEAALKQAKADLATFRADSKSELAGAKTRDAEAYREAVKQARANFTANVGAADEASRQAFEARAAELGEEIQATETAIEGKKAERAAANQSLAEQQIDRIVADNPGMAPQRDKLVKQFADYLNKNPNDPASSPIEFLDRYMAEQSKERAAIERARNKVGKSGIFAKMRGKGRSWLRRS